jgi:hypothetical protein
MIKHVAFVQPIPVLGTSKRQDQFSWPEWRIQQIDAGVRLYRPEAQNVPEVPWFDVVGVGFCIGQERDDAAQSADTSNGPSDVAPEPAGIGSGGGDGGAPEAGTKQAQSRKARTKGKVT